MSEQAPWTLHGIGPAGWTYTASTWAAVLALGLAIAAGNWANAWSQILIVILIQHARYWRNKATTTPAKGAEDQ